MTFAIQLRRILVPCAIALFGFALLFPLTGNSITLAQGGSAYIEMVRFLETADVGLLNPAGLAFSPVANAFLVVEADTRTGANIITITPYEDLVSSARLSVSQLDPTNMAFDSQTNRLLVLETLTEALIEIKAKPDGHLDALPDAATRFQIGGLGLGSPQGITIDPTDGSLFILDNSAAKILRIEPGPQGSFEGAAALAGGRVSWIDLKDIGLVNPRGLAFNPDDGHLYVLDPAIQSMYKLSEAGQVMATFDLSPFGLVDPQGLVFAPSGDPTDDASIINLYIADSGLRSGEGQLSATELSTSELKSARYEIGRIIEFSLTPSAQMISAAAATIPATLVRTTDTSTYDPPSPDPSGLAFLSSSGTLMISDGEVEETVAGITHFDGANVWEITLGGSVVRTANISKVAPTVVPLTNEPTGVAWNPTNGHFFFTDDDTQEVYELNPGTDGQVGTTDDTWTSFDTLVFGSTDPEGIAYDTWHGYLFVVDGLGEEVYKIDPGTDGIFNGVAPAGDDQIAQFDTTSLGLRDPEGIEFNPDSGHLYILSDTDNAIAETTIAGTVIRYIDISSVGAVKAAGLAYAPASANPAQMNLYIVDRGVDNDSNPNENDGRLYEISFLEYSIYLPIVVRQE